MSEVPCGDVAYFTCVTDPVGRGRSRVRDRAKAEEGTYRNKIYSEVEVADIFFAQVLSSCRKLPLLLLLLLHQLPLLLHPRRKGREKMKRTRKTSSQWAPTSAIPPERPCANCGGTPRSSCSGRGRRNGKEKRGKERRRGRRGSGTATSSSSPGRKCVRNAGEKWKDGMEVFFVGLRE